MISTDKPNPFSVLMLPTSATQAEIISRAEELHLLAETDEETLLIRWAAEQLRTNQRTRLEYALFELPETHYADESWEAFTRQYKLRGAILPTQIQDAPEPEAADLDPAALVELHLEQILVRNEPDLEQALHGSPLVPRYTFPLKEEDVICG